MLKGDLSSFSLGEVFQSLAINNHTGTLKITHPVYSPKLIYFENGKITLFSSGSPGVPRLGEMLVRLGKISQQDLDEALAEQKESKELLGEVFLRKDLVTEQELKYALEKKIREEIYDLFLWKQGHFEFHLNYFPDEYVDDLQKKARISLDANSATIGGLRQLDEWTVIHKNIRSFNEIPAQTSTKYEGDDKVVRYLLDHTDGLSPVKEIIKNTPAGQFESCKALHQLIEGGQLRLLCLEELRILAAKKIAEKHFPQAAAFLQFAVEIQPDDAEIHSQLGDMLASYYQEEAAKDAYLVAMRLYFKAGDPDRATKIGEKILHKTILTDDDLECLVNGHLKLGDVKRATYVAGQLVASLQKKGELQKAAAVLKPIADLNPKDLNLKIQIATILEKSGDKEGATAHLEDVASNLEHEKRIRDHVRILRLIVAIDPKRQDLKQRIATLQELQEKLVKRRRRRITIVSCGAILLAVLTLVPILYEVKSREAFYHAKRLEEISRLSGDFTQVRAAYEEVISRYSFSTKAAEAQAALAQIASLEKGRMEQFEQDSTQRKKEQDAKLLAMKEALTSALESATIAESQGDLKKAYEIYTRVKKDFADLPTSKEILFPLRISTYPAGAVAVVDEKEIGKTPVTYHYKPGSTIHLMLTRSSCEIRYQTVELNDQWELHFPLARRPIGELSLVPTLQQPMVVAGSSVVFPSRDGGLYAIDQKKRVVVWQRTVGRFGDRVSNLAAWGDEVYLGTVSAEASAISATTGRSRWIARVGGAVLAAPGVSDDGKWIAVGTTKGTVEILNNETGSIRAKFSTENEVLSRPIFVNTVAVVGSTDNYLYGYSMEKQDLDFLEDLGGDVVIDPCRFGGTVIVATASGTIHCFDVEARKIVWTWTVKERPAVNVTALTVVSGVVYAGTSDGRIVALEGKNGGLQWEAVAGSGSIAGFSASPDRLYFGMDSGRIVSFDMGQRKTAWDIQLDSAIIAAPTLSEGMLYFGTASGKIQFIEVLE